MGIGISVITHPVNRIIGLSAWSIAFALILGAINGWWMQSVDAGLVGTERFDRIVKVGSNDAEDAWAAVTATKDPDIKTADAGNQATVHNPSATLAHLLQEGDNGDCRIGEIKAGNTSARDISVASATYYTPAGTKVTVPAVQADGHVSNPEQKDIAISGCKWEDGTSVFNAGGLGGLAALILQACGLAAPVALMFELAKLGSSFVSNFTDNAILSAVITVIMFLVVATLLNVFVPFLTGAFTAVDSNRFGMFDSGLGSIAVVIRNFWGIVLIGSLLGVAWSVIGSIRGRSDNAMNAGRAM